MEIPKTVSTPLDSDRLSFMGLPAEIRIMVYSLLFRRKGPVLVHNVRAYYAQKPTEPERDTNCEDSDHGIGTNDVTYDMTYVTGETHNDYCSRYREYQTEFQKWFEQLQSEEESLSEFNHGFAAGLGLMKTCRQTYHEAADILYGKNAFTVSRVLSRHDTFWEEDEESSYHQLVYASIWLRSLGTQRNLLRTVSIDMSAVCDYDCDHSTSSCNVLPILRMVWDRSIALCNITFTRTGRTLTSACHEEHEVGEEVFSEENINLLNHTLLELGQNDGLQLKRYAYSSLLMSAIVIYTRRNSVEAHVEFFSEFKIDRHFRKSADGSLLWKPKQRIRPLFDLPETTLTKIYQYAASSIDGVVLDMDTQDTHGLDSSILRNAWILRHNRAWRSAVDEIFSQVPLNLRLTISESAIGLDHFQALERVYPAKTKGDRYAVKPVGLLEFVIQETITSKNGDLTITLGFDLIERRPLPDLRIKVNSLMDIVCNPEKYEVPDNTKLLLTLRFPLEPTIGAAATMITIQDLRKALFLYLTDLLKQLPDQFPLMPEVWIDGTGAFVNKANAPMGFQATEADSWDFEIYGQPLIVIVDEVNIRFGSKYTRHECCSHNRRDCMYCPWMTLRDEMSKQWGRWESALQEHKLSTAKRVKGADSC